jgi:hypothetical protein
VLLLRKMTAYVRDGQQANAATQNIDGSGAKSG